MQHLSRTNIAEKQTKRNKSVSVTFVDVGLILDGFAFQFYARTSKTQLSSVFLK